MRWQSRQGRRISDSTINERASDRHEYASLFRKKRPVKLKSIRNAHDHPQSVVSVFSGLRILPLERNHIFSGSVFKAFTIDRISIIEMIDGCSGTVSVWIFLHVRIGKAPACNLLRNLLDFADRQCYDFQHDSEHRAGLGTSWLEPTARRKTDGTPSRVEQIGARSDHAYRLYQEHTPLQSP